MLSTAYQVYLTNNPSNTDQLNPRLAHIAIEEASWIDSDKVQAMWAGLLASSASPDGQSDENLVFMNILKQLSSLEVQVLQFAVDQVPKFASTYGLPLPQKVVVPVDKLSGLFGDHDLQRLDRELDHLRELGLIGFGEGGGIEIESSDANLTPTPLALHLYVRAQGSRLSPTEYWSLKPVGG
jgi:hypothetical protein